MSYSSKRPVSLPTAPDPSRSKRNHPSNSSSTKIADTFCMTTLPRAVLELIVSFAVKEVSAVKVLPTKQRGYRRLVRVDKTPLAVIAEWRLVCSYWRDLLGEILAQYQQRTFKVDLSYKFLEQQTEALQEVIQAGTHVRELRIALFGHSSRDRAVKMTQLVDWEELLRGCPNLERLDVSKMAFLTRRRLGEVLDAASHFCLKLEALVLPLPLGWKKRVVQMVDDDNDAELVQHLASALEHWLIRGSRGGLRQLVMPHVPALSDTFLTAITQFCPNVEILDGWKLTYLSDGWGAVLCDEAWRVSLDVWEQFCRQCTHLREFNWAVVPFADAFFMPFGATQKYRLADLAFDFTDAFLSKISTPIHLQPVVTPSRVSIHQPVRQRPTLTGTLDDHELPIRYDASRAYSSNGLCSLVRGLPFLRSIKVFLHPRYRIDLSVFDDAFLQQLSKSSPYLGRFSFSEAGKYSGIQALESISDQGLLSLAEMTHLSDIAIAALPAASGTGVLSFISGMSPLIQQRNVKIGILRGIDKTIVSLLKLVAQEPAGTFADRAFALMLVNVANLRGFSRKTRSPSAWKDRLKELHGRLQTSHPTLRFQLELEQQRPRPGATIKDVSEIHYVANFSIFSINWKFPDVADGTFFRGDISNSDPFEWVVQC